MEQEQKKFREIKDEETFSFEREATINFEYVLNWHLNKISSASITNEDINRPVALLEKYLLPYVDEIYMKEKKELIEKVEKMSGEDRDDFYYMELLGLLIKQMDRLGLLLSSFKISKMVKMQRK